MGLASQITQIVARTLGINPQGIFARELAQAGEEVEKFFGDLTGNVDHTRMNPTRPRGPVGEAVANVFRALGELTHAIGDLVHAAVGGQFPTGPTLIGGHFMIIVKDTNPDVRYAVGGFIVKDAEGQVISDPAVLAGITVEVASDAVDVVAVTPDAGDPKNGSAHFGAPGVANVTAQVKLADGTLVGSFGEQFTVTVGDPAAIEGGAITFEGLTPATPTPPAP